MIISWPSTSQSLPQKARRVFPPKKKSWRRPVKLRAGKRCEICFADKSNLAARILGSKSNQRLHIHHIYPRRTFPERVRDPENLVLLCQECHVAVEGKWGTRTQIINWGRAIILRLVVKQLREAS
jgi:5-methylcytosine-specific restriction endonuclease McrA